MRGGTFWALEPSGIYMGRLWFTPISWNSMEWCDFAADILQKWALAEATIYAHFLELYGIYEYLRQFLGTLWNLHEESKKQEIGRLISESRHNQQFQLIFKEKLNLWGGVLSEPWSRLGTLWTSMEFTGIYMGRLLVYMAFTWGD